MKKIFIIFIFLLLASCGAGNINNNSGSILDTESTAGGGYGEPATQDGTR